MDGEVRKVRMFGSCCGGSLFNVHCPKVEQ